MAFIAVVQTCLLSSLVFRGHCPGLTLDKYILSWPTSKCGKHSRWGMTHTVHLGSAISPLQNIKLFIQSQSLCSLHLSAVRAQRKLCRRANCHKKKKNYVQAVSTGWHPLHLKQSQSANWIIPRTSSQRWVEGTKTSFFRHDLKSRWMTVKTQQCRWSREHASVQSSSQMGYQSIFQSCDLWLLDYKRAIPFQSKWAENHILVDCLNAAKSTWRMNIKQHCLRVRLQKRKSAPQKDGGQSVASCEPKRPETAA